MTLRANLVLGGTGKTGSRVVGRLRALGLSARAAHREGHGAERFDWDEESTWGPALEGARTVYLVHREVASREAAPALAAFCERAVMQGAERLVLLSALGYPDVTGPAEQAVRDAAPRQWTVLQPTWFAQDFSEDFLRDPVRSGEVRLPEGDGAVPFVDAEDIADVAVAALTDESGRHHGQTYGLTGPRAVSFPEAVAEIAQATGRDVRYVPVPEDEYAATLRADGIPDQSVEEMLGILRPALQGELSATADGVQRALDRPPRDFAEYVSAAAATRVWSPAG